jgi:hypothetical protein
MDHATAERLASKLEKTKPKPESIQILSVPAEVGLVATEDTVKVKRGDAPEDGREYRIDVRFPTEGKQPPLETLAELGKDEGVQGFAGARGSVLYA